MNTQLVSSLVQIIRSLSKEERSALTEQLFFDSSYPTSFELTILALQGESLEFLNREPDLYTLADGEPI